MIYLVLQYDFQIFESNRSEDVCDVGFKIK